MKEIPEKPIYRILNLVSILALSYYAVTSVNYIFESEPHIYNYEAHNDLNWSTAQLEPHKLDR